jgi:serine/threonine protein phosphatase PrpC
VQPENGGMLPCDRLYLPAALCQLIQEANAQIRAEGVRRANAGGSSQVRVRFPKTTVALVTYCHHWDEDGYTVVTAHVGDSRIYLLREQEPPAQLTPDDGLLGTLIRSQKMSETEALRVDQATDARQLSNEGE